MNDLGNLLRLYRLLRNMDQQGLSVLAGLSRSTVTRIESGDRRPNDVSLRGLIRAMGLSDRESDSLYLAAQMLPPRWLLIEPDEFEASREFFHQRLEESDYLAEEMEKETTADRHNPRGPRRRSSVINHIRTIRAQHAT